MSGQEKGKKAPEELTLEDLLPYIRKFYPDSDIRGSVIRLIDRSRGISGGGFRQQDIATGEWKTYLRNEELIKYLETELGI